MKDVNVNFPPIKEFYEKFCGAVKESGGEQRFVTKWGLEKLSEVYGILENNVQGGYDSHKQSMLTNRNGAWDSVLTIGPGMGFCGFLLSELYDSVYIAEPDGDNCELLQGIASQYRSGGNKAGDDHIQVLHAGLAITDEAIKYWQAKRKMMEKRKLKGGILNFNINEATQLREVFDRPVSRIYLHKVLSSFSIAGSFDRIIGECAALLSPGGIITWSEPEYIFTDILMATAEDPLNSRIKPAFDNVGMEFQYTEYEVSNAVAQDETPLREKWTLIQAWKK
ncbi:MAG: hypothetical protein GY940_12365 [bacterium]|nr:hypothetical protein [bacterium]